MRASDGDPDFLASDFLDCYVCRPAPSFQYSQPLVKGYRHQDHDVSTRAPVKVSELIVLCSATCIALVSSASNVIILYVLDGKEMIWVCLGACGIDVSPTLNLWFILDLPLARWLSTPSSCTGPCTDPSVHQLLAPNPFDSQVLPNATRSRSTTTAAAVSKWAQSTKTRWVTRPRSSRMVNPKRTSCPKA